jgi:uncharacterized protein YndB with AHSA1/START domain
MSDERDVVSVSRVINAPPEAIFALLSDPSRHQDFDGSGTVRASNEQPERLRLGSKFGMSMKQGVSYSMVNEVVEFEENRRLAWAPHMKAFAWVSGGRIWRYELEPVDGGTRVTETWDITKEKSKVFVRAAGKKTRANMEATLARLDELATKPA